MATYGLDVECPHIFDGTHFARWRNWMTCNFKFICPQMWWMVDVGFSHVLDENNLTQTQEKCLDQDIQATNILFRSLHDCILCEVMNMKTAHEIWSYLNEKYGAASDDHDDYKTKEEVHEDDEHIHDMVVVEDCSTSWSSDDDQSTTSSLDIIDSDDSSVANDDPTPSTLDDQVGSCMDDIYTSSSSPSSHCFMSQGDTKVSNCNVIDPNSYDELLNRYASMTKLFEEVLAKTIKFEKENSFLKDTCEQQKHLLYVMSCSHEELKLTHEELSVAHENLVLDHALLTSKLCNKGIKTSESSSHGSNDQLQNVANPCDVGKKHVSTSCDDLLSMPCTSHIDACSSSTMQYETNLVEENKELQSQVKYLSNKIERWTKSKVTLESIIKNQRNFGDMSGIGSNKSKVKGKRWEKKKYEKEMKKQ